MADGSENILTDGADADYDAALFSCVSLTLDGSGQLTVIGNNQEGIASEENITINGGTYRITSADDGINASHDGASVITINDGYLTISATKGLEKEEKDNDNGHYIRRERYAGACSRSFYVGKEVEKEDIKAEFKHGILTLFVPKKEAKPAVEQKHSISIEG
mgnify:CR=1 FL=1